jgi:hypothetical protein
MLDEAVWFVATVYLSADRATALSAFRMYEFHSTQSGTHIHPGQTFDLDYSLNACVHVFGLTTASGTGRLRCLADDREDGAEYHTGRETQRYGVNALGIGLNYALPARKVTRSFKYFHEFSNQWTYQGHSLQISCGVTF